MGVNTISAEYREYQRFANILADDIILKLIGKHKQFERSGRTILPLGQFLLEI